MDPVIRGKEKGPVDVSQVVGVGVVGKRIRDTRINVGHKRRSRPVALPQFPTMNVVRGGEIQCPIDVGQIVGVGVGISGIDVRDQGGGSPIGFP